MEKMDMHRSTFHALDDASNLPLVRTLTESTFLWRLLKLCLMTMIFLKALHLSYFGLLGKFNGLTDFNAFHLAGSLALGGHLSDAYHIEQMRAAQSKLTDAVGFMPWTYPLPFNLITSLLALLPIGAAYFLFTTTSLIAYLSVLRRLVGAELFLVTFLNLPAVLLNVECGQNGLLTASLIGLFCLWSLEGRRVAGIPLGLMIIKPHLIAGVGIYLMLKRDWQTLVIAGLVGVGVSTVATVIYGPDMWGHFFQAIHESTDMLKEEKYPLFRMSSAFAMVVTITHHYEWSWLFQIASIALALSILILSIRRTTSPRTGLGMACVASALFSPYIYDYDLLIVGIGIALLLPVFHKNMTSLHQSLVAVGLLLAQGGWLLLTPLVLAENKDQAEATLSVVPSLGCFFIVIISGLLLAAIDTKRIAA
jgi:hypothetical protein